ncbi:MULTISPECIES: HdeD family acid-resistance protein [Streptomyces]|uniref:HdeD family acid-resistance protein n=2 Tax=Streptomyces TaxID=1883 RepID=A0A4Q9HM99_STRKA|nr:MULTISPECIES: HdeD family acid-resistance protein [Streptomyces]MYU56078.1 HdeD family acid-resistance protein [Streptomyces sp. SID7805]TBO55120.1 HdeD family acid-resistance protein [Streptomyces kasugaensis]WSK16746.1 HdeD family acid-resistance protein [Streptomyces celluloflavus]
MTDPSTASGDSPPQPRATSAEGEALGILANLGWQALFTIGLASIALGVVVLVWPGKTLLVVGIAFGAYLLVSGVFQLASAFGSHVPGHLRALHFVTGAISVLLGLICFRGTMQSILLLALWIGFGWLLRGIMMTAAAGSAPGAPARGWQLFVGIITLLAGIVLIVSPFGSIAALTLVTGIMAIVLGIAEVVNAIRLRIAIGRGTKGTATKHRRSVFQPRPHPQH